MAIKKLTTAKPQFGNNFPFSQKKTRRRFNPNIQKKRIFVPELGKFVQVKISTRELRTIDKIGVSAFLKDRGMSLKDLED